MTRSRISFVRSLEAEEPTVNLTPLIDVVFVILIMFIVIAPLLERDRVELANAPSSASAAVSSVQEKSPITLHVQKDNTLLFNSQNVSLKELTPLLRDAKLKHPHVHPQIFHDRAAYFGTYQDVKNAVEAAGFSHVDIILIPSKD